MSKHTPILSLASDDTSGTGLTQEVQTVTTDMHWWWSGYDEEKVEPSECDDMDPLQ